MAAENLQVKWKEEGEVCMQQQSKAVCATREICTEAMVSQVLVAPCSRTPWAGGPQLSDWTRHGIWWSYPSICLFSQLWSRFSLSLDKEESPVRRGVKGSTLHRTPMHPVPQGCSEACFPMPKSRWERTVQGPRQGKVGASLLGYGPLRLFATSEFLPWEL